ncbi:hypothetical protein [Bacillus xiapuensis]|uniref:Uncharacterized protein n=1 Tax=Bacillus xiapuensis TaxID=2014075 RepID=A0ABU6N521_9BACI|nr:hypothetical protein [Bacillus xiapuensis]
MVGLIIAILLFNLIAFKTNKILTGNLIAHIWMFTVALQTLFDTIIEFKFYAYWYFDKGADWLGLLPHIFLVPPVNMIFLNWFPYTANIFKKAVYIFFFVITILLYELVTLLPEPWGYFHYGWWKFWHAAILDPILLLILLGYYKWVQHLERKALGKK